MEQHELHENLLHRIYRNRWRKLRRVVKHNISACFVFEIDFHYGNGNGTGNGTDTATDVDFLSHANGKL